MGIMAVVAGNVIVGEVFSDVEGIKDSSSSWTNSLCLA